MKKSLALILAILTCWQMFSYAAVVTVNQQQFSRFSSATHVQFSTHYANTFPHGGAKDRSGIIGGGTFSMNQSVLNYSDYYLTISSTTAYTVWENGRVTKLATGDQILITDPSTPGLRFIYYQNGVLVQSKSPWDITATTAPVAIIYIVDATHWSIGLENHSADRSRPEHAMLHLTVGARIASGFVGTFATGSFSIGEGTMYDEDLPHRIATKTAVRAWHRSAGGGMAFVDNISTPYYAPAGVLKYDNAGTLTTAGNAKYVANYFYATNDIHYPIAMVVGQSQHTTLADARSESLPTILDMPTREWKLLYRTITKTGPTYQEAADYRESSSLPGGSINSLPASSVTFTSYTANRVWTNVQQAITETNRLMPVVCGTNPLTAVFDGAPGATGATGATGAAGAAATIGVGAVNTVENNVAAAVRNTGSSLAAIFDFDIPKGKDGDINNITQSQIEAKIAESGGSLSKRSISADTERLYKATRYAGTLGLYITGSGLIYALDTAGKVTWGFNPDTKMMRMGSYSTNSTRNNFTIDNYGQITRYATNGTTVIYKSYSSGREKWFSATTGKLQAHKEPDGKFTRYRPDGTTARYTDYTAGRLQL